MNIRQRLFHLIRKNLPFRLSAVILFLSLQIFIFLGCLFISELLLFLVIPVVVLAFLIFNNNEPLDFELSPGLKACGAIIAFGGFLGGIMFITGFLGFFVAIFFSRGSLIVIETTPLLAEQAQYLLGTKEVPRLLYLIIKGCMPWGLTGISLLLTTAWGLPNVKKNHIS